MSRRHEPDPAFDPRIAEWLEADPDDAPGQVLDTVLAAFPSIPQRRAMRLPRRPLIMNRFGYLAAATAITVIAVVAVGVGGLLNSTAPPTVASLPPPSSVASSPVASPSPTPTPTRPLARNGAIAFPKEGAIVLIDPVTGKTLKALPVDSVEVGALAWAPDGRSLAITAPGGIRILDVTDGTSRQILSCGEGIDGCSIAWAPDGSRIAVAHGDTLELVDPDGSDRATVFVQPDPIMGRGLTMPTWSPDGSRIAFRGWAGSGHKDGDWLFAVNRDGSDPTLILGPVPGIGVFDPAWSPDGSTIAYIGSTDRECSGTSKTPCGDPWQLHVMSVALDGSHPRELHEAGTCYCVGFAPSLTWSPDGTSLAFVASGGEGVPAGGLLVMNADGTGLRQVAADGGEPAWQPVP